jgi:hypothetical protein
MVHENGTDRDKVPKFFQLGAVLTFLILSFHCVLNVVYFLLGSIFIGRWMKNGHSSSTCL